jgi:hypothetical protein
MNAYCYLAMDHLVLVTKIWAFTWVLRLLGATRSKLRRALMRAQGSYGSSVAPANRHAVASMAQPWPRARCRARSNRGRSAAIRSARQQHSPLSLRPQAPAFGSQNAYGSHGCSLCIPPPVTAGCPSNGMACLSPPSPRRRPHPRPSLRSRAHVRQRAHARGRFRVRAPQAHPPP